MALFKKIVDEMATIPEITRIKLVGLNEPLLDPYIVERIEYSKQKAPQVLIETFTNGFHLTPEMFDKVKRAGLASLIVSLNAINQKQHEQIMGVAGRFDETCKNIEYAIKNQEDVHIEVHAVINHDMFTIENALGFYQRWGHIALGGHGNCIKESNWAGENRDVKVRNFEDNECCFRATNGISILHDGRMVPCCYDPTGKMEFGNLNDQTLREIYNSQKYTTFRIDHFMDNADKYEICRGCARI